MLTRRNFLSATALVVTMPCRLDAAEPDQHLKIFDTHIHLFTGDLLRYPLHASDRVRPRLLQAPNTVENVLREMDESGVNGGVGVQYRTAYGNDTRYLLDSTDAHRDKIVPVVGIDSTDPSSPEQLRVGVLSHGVKGVRLVEAPDNEDGMSWLDSPATQKIWTSADQLGIAVVLFFRTPTAPLIDRVAAMADMFPRVRIVLDHVGHPPVEGAPDFGLGGPLGKLRWHRNVYYKFSTINFIALTAAKLSLNEFVRHLVDVYGADHVTWGSDYGNSQGTYSELVASAFASATMLTGAERASVLAGTGRSLFT